MLDPMVLLMEPAEVPSKAGKEEEPAKISSAHLEQIRRLCALERKAAE